MSNLPGMITVKKHDAVLLLPSRALQVTCVCPISKVDPDSALQVTTGVSPELSVAVGLSQTTFTIVWLTLALTVGFDGQVIIGASVSEKISDSLNFEF